MITALRAGQLGPGHVAPDGGSEWMPLEAHAPFAAARPVHGASGPARKGLPTSAKAVLAAGALALVGVVGFQVAKASRSTDLDVRVVSAELDDDERFLDVVLDVDTGGTLNVRARRPGHHVLEAGPDDEREDPDGDELRLQLDVGSYPGGDQEVEIDISSKDWLGFRSGSVDVPFEKEMAIRWRGDGKTEFGELDFFGAYERRGITFGLPKGAKATVAGKPVRSRLPHKPDPLPGLAQADYAVKGGKVPFPFEVTLADGTVLKDAFVVEDPKTITDFCAKAAMKAKDGPVPFGEEGGSAVSKPERIVYDEKVYGGELANCRDIDWVVVRKKKTRTRSCGRYKGSQSGKVVTVRARAHDDHYQAIDRRTGRVMKTHVARAKMPACPSTMRRNRGLSRGASPLEGTRFVRSLL